MRVYIIGNDGLTLCREAPATVNEGNCRGDERGTARRAAQRQAALGIVERSPRCRKAQESRRPRGADRSAVVGHRGPAGPGGGSRRETSVEAGRGHCDAAATGGATVDEVATATGWQRHTVRGVFSGTFKKKLGLTLASAKEDRGRVYRIHEPAIV
jgi:hypothetical protein